MQPDLSTKLIETLVAVPVAGVLYLWVRHLMSQLAQAQKIIAEKDDKIQMCGNVLREMVKEGHTLSTLIRDRLVQIEERLKERDRK